MVLACLKEVSIKLLLIYGKQGRKEICLRKVTRTVDLELL